MSAPTHALQAQSLPLLPTKAYIANMCLSAHGVLPLSLSLSLHLSMYIRHRALVAQTGVLECLRWVCGLLELYL